MLFQTASGYASVVFPSILATVEGAAFASATSSILALKLAFLHSVFDLVIDDTSATCRHQEAF